MDRPGAGVSQGARALAGNTAWLFVGQLAAKAAGVVFLVIVARALDVRDYGYFTFAAAFVPLLLSFGVLGLDTVVVRDLARDKDRLSEVFSSGLVLRVLTGLAALGLAFALTPLFVDSRLALLAVLILGLGLFVDELSAYLSTVFRAYERMRYHALVLVVNRLGTTMLAVVAYAAGAGLVVITVTYLAGSLGALVFSALLLRRHFPPIRLRAAQRTTARRLLVAGAPLGVAAVLNMALFRVDTVMVEAYLGPQEVGLYGVAFRFFESFLFVAWMLGTLTLPRFSRDGSGPTSRRTLDAAMAAALAFYVPIAVGSLFAAEWAVRVVFGTRYSEAAEAVPWLTLALVFYAITYQARTASVGVGGRGAIAWIAAAALLVNVVANVVLIPRHGFLGAAMATAGACFLEALLTLLVTGRLGVLGRPGRLLAVPLVAGAAMVGVLAGFGLTAGTAVLAGAAAYGVALLASGAALAPEQRRWLVGVVRARTAP